MGLLKSWASRLWSQVDHAVAELEDHDALVDAALRELEVAAKKARRELARVRGDGEALRSRLAQERVNATAWRKDAATSPTDEGALELLRHARRARRRAAHLEARVREHGAAEARLDEHATLLRERLETLARQHHLMRTRRAQAEAMPAIRLDDAPIEEIFERWDMVLTRAEHIGDPFGDLEREEEERALVEELGLLRRNKETA
jgi:phage shock protein A